MYLLWVFLSQYFMTGDIMLFVYIHGCSGVSEDTFGKLVLSFHFYIDSED